MACNFASGFVKEVWGNREMAYQTFLLLGLYKKVF